MGILLSSCATAPPTVEPCTIVNRTTAQCTSTDPNIPEHDLKLREMIAYTCMSPNDIGEVRKYMRKVLIDAEQNMSHMENQLFIDFAGEF